MRAGLLRHRFTLEDPGQTVALGEAAIPWTVQATLYGDLRGFSGSATGLLPEADYRLTIRWRSDLEANAGRWRVGLVGTDRKFAILSCVDPTGRRERLELNLRETL